MMQLLLICIILLVPSGIADSTQKRCKKSSPSGNPVQNAKQTIVSFSPNKDGTKYNYNEVLHKSILFYEAQRSGKMPSNNRVPWRGDSALKDGCDVGTDATGGWYDAGNFVKFNFPMAFSLTTLAWGGIAFRDAYKDAGELEHMTELVKWGAEYFIRCHVSKYEFIAQVGNPENEHDSWGRPEEMSFKRPSYKVTKSNPGTEVVAEAAAALAASSIFLKKEKALSKSALQHAKELYEFADKYRKTYHLSIPDGELHYKSYSGFEDELLWAAAWLYKATKDSGYLKDAKNMYMKLNGQVTTGEEYSWDTKLVGSQALLGDLTGDQIYLGRFFNFLDNLEVAPTNAKGMHFRGEWSPNRYTGGAAFMAVIGASLKPAPPRKNAYIKWAKKQLDLILGDTGKSFVIGFGKKYPKMAHHRASSCPPYPQKCDWETFHSPKPNHYILYGALVGGTDKNGAFTDDREDTMLNQVACDYNAGFQSAIAGLKHFAMKGRKQSPSTKAPASDSTATIFSSTTAKPQSKATTEKSVKITTTKTSITYKPPPVTPTVSEKERCAKGSPTGKAVFRASQTPLSFKPNNDGTKHNYNKVLHMSILFFEAQRSGRLPPDQRVPWRGDSSLKDGCEIGVDLSGGWYDAGDHVKFHFPMAFSLTTLAWGGIAFRDAYEDSGEVKNMINAVRWPTEYLIKAHISKYEFVAQVGNGALDHKYWGRPETMNMKRPVYKITAKRPGSDLAAEAAAALAAASIFLKPYDPELSNKALTHAKELYEFADKFRGLYHVSVQAAKKFYQSTSGYNDELIWGAAWLYKASKERRYLTLASNYYNRISGRYIVESRYSWDRKLCGAQALLAELTGEAIYRNPLVGFLDNLLKAKTTPQGLHFLSKWGSNRYAAGAALIANIGATLNPPLPRRASYKKWAEKQIGILLGDAGNSFVVGYGKNYPKRPHHRSSSCPPYPARCGWPAFKSPEKNYYILYGALVGGPDEKGKYVDRRQRYEQTEVTTDYNACFQSAVAGVKHFAMKKREKVTPAQTTETSTFVLKTTQPGTNGTSHTDPPDSTTITTETNLRTEETDLGETSGKKTKKEKKGKGGKKNKKGKCKPKRSIRCIKEAMLAKKRKLRNKEKKS